MLCAHIRIASSRRSNEYTQHALFYRRSKILLQIIAICFLTWHHDNPQLLELPMSRTSFHGPKNVRAIEVNCTVWSMAVWSVQKIMTRLTTKCILTRSCKESVGAKATNNMLNYQYIISPCLELCGVFYNLCHAQSSVATECTFPCNEDKRCRYVGLQNSIYIKYGQTY